LIAYLVIKAIEQSSPVFVEITFFNVAVSWRCMSAEGNLRQAENSLPHAVAMLPFCLWYKALSTPSFLSTRQKMLLKYRERRDMIFA
jgi:hypothetical protein